MKGISSLFFFLEVVKGIMVQQWKKNSKYDLVFFA